MRRTEVIERALEAIRLQNGGILTRSAVVAAARNKRHPLHREFEWDDRKAGQRYRLLRAQKLIVHYLTVTVVTRSEKVCAPYYVKTPIVEANEQGYMPVTTIAELNRESCERTLLVELERCEGCVNRARAIVGILDLKHPGLSARLEHLLSGVVRARAALAEVA